MYGDFNSRFWLSVLGTCLLAAGINHYAAAQPDPTWKIHDMARPEAPVVTPGELSTQKRAGRPPSDAIVLFDGTDLSQWESSDGAKPSWKVANGYMWAAGEGGIRTRRSFGSCQLHVEWATPPRETTRGRRDGNEGAMRTREDRSPATPFPGQDAGNSGVFLMEKYEVQVLDSYENRTYADGHAAAVYAQYPPLVNASMPPEAWQTYDIIFHAPRFERNGSLAEPAAITVLHNGVLVQDNVEITGPTGWMNRPPYEAHSDRLPVSLQDHGNPVRFRNIWIRELAEQRTEERPEEKSITLPIESLQQYVGGYGGDSEEESFITITLEEGRLMAKPGDTPKRQLHAESELSFFLKEVDVRIEFKRGASGRIEGLTFSLAGGLEELKKVR